MGTRTSIVNSKLMFERVPGIPHYLHCFPIFCHISHFSSFRNWFCRVFVAPLSRMVLKNFLTPHAVAQGSPSWSISTCWSQRHCRQESMVVTSWPLKLGRLGWWSPDIDVIVQRGLKPVTREYAYIFFPFCATFSQLVLVDISEAKVWIIHIYHQEVSLIDSAKLLGIKTWNLLAFSWLQLHSCWSISPFCCIVDDSFSGCWNHRNHQCLPQLNTGEW